MSDELKPCNAPAYIHGAWMKHNRLYNVWATMLHRCNDKTREKYKDYGGRGISVCEEWDDPNTFIDWALSNGYKQGLQLDRIDNNGNYCPTNCRWVTPKQNSRNRRNTVYLTINGETKCVSEWCETINVSPYTIYWWNHEYGRRECEKRVERRINEIAGVKRKWKKSN